jgi:competence protein ComEC
LIFCLGAARFQSHRVDIRPNHIAWYNDTGSYATIIGLVVKPPDVRDSYIGLEIEVESIRFGPPGTSVEVGGKILARSTRFIDWSYGDRVIVRGFLETPPEYETFSYRDYLERQGVHGMVTFAGVDRLSARKGHPLLHIIYDLRLKALTTIQRLFPDPEASLISGILVGEEQGIAPKVREAFDQTSTSHIIAISGFNITIIAAVLQSFFRRIFGARRGVVLAGLGIIFYTILVGADAAVLRAAVMGSLTLIALRMGRQTAGLASLSAAAILMSFFDPNVLWDVGFQLSFAATLGLMLYAPGMEKIFLQLAGKYVSSESAKRWAKPVSEFILVTFAAQIMTLPLTVLYFQRFPLTSIVANPVILPLQPALMIIAGLATIVGMLSQPLGQLIAWVAWPFPALTIRAVTFFAGLPLSTIQIGEFGPIILVVSYAALFTLTAYTSIPKERRPVIQLPSIQVAKFLAPMAILALLLWRMAADRPDGFLHITVLDVGEGDATLLQSPSGRFLLIDGGPSTIALSESLGRRLPLFDRGLDWLLIAGTREDQLGGLTEGITRFTPSKVLASGPARPGAYRYLFDQITEEGIPILEAQQGQILDLGGGCTLEVISVSEHGAAYLLQYGDFRFMLAPGADPEMVTHFEGSGFPSSVTAILLPDGGSETVNPPSWLTHLRLQLALISIEAGNRRSLPSEAVLKALEGSTILRTDTNGWIELKTDGDRLWVEVERDPGN